MFDAMILYAVVAISLLTVYLFHPVLFALLDAAASLMDVAIARDARSKATGAPVPLADDMEALRIEVAPSDSGTTRVVSKPVRSSITS